LQKDFQPRTSLTQSSSWNNLIGGFNSITQALTSGDLGAAQAAYAELQQALQMQMQASTHRSVTQGSSSSGR
jgi:hypothetical protein